MAEDPFAVLGVAEDATNKKVESAFRRLALRCHPDRHPKDPLAKARFLRLGRAKETLLDPVKRTAAQSQRRSRFLSQRQKPSTNQPRPQRNVAAEAAEKRRQAAAERLKQREVEAEGRKRQAREAAEAKRHCDALAAKKEEEARELAARRERRKMDLFDAFLRKKAKHASTTSEAAQPTLVALVNRFASSSEQRLVVPGPLSAAEHAELRAAVARHGLILTEKNGSFEAQRPHEPSESDSPWEPPEGTRSDKKAKRLRKRASKSSAGDAAAQRHQKALERLQRRRSNGEGLTNTPQGSWWIHDEEADRFAKDIDYCGF